MVFALLFCWAVLPGDGPAQKDPYVLWLNNNKRMEVQAPPECVGARCQVTLLNGEVTSLPSKMIDLERSATYNKELAEKRETARREAEEAARAAAEKREKMLAKHKERRLEVKSNDELPKFVRKNTAVEIKSEDALVGEPIVNVFQSQHPVFVAREIISKYTDYYTVECSVRNAKEELAKDIKVTLTVNFANAATQTQSKTVVGNLKKGETSALVFKLEGSDEMIRTTYKVEAIAAKAEVPTPQEGENN